MIDEAFASDPKLLTLLSRHPKVAKVSPASIDGIHFRQGSWERELVFQGAESAIGGLVELIDNNPVVCADRYYFPPAEGVLASIALGPLVLASLMVEPPTILFSEPFNSVVVDQEVARLGWTQGVTAAFDEMDFGTAIAATAIAAITTPPDLTDLDNLYEECFGRSFYIKRDEQSTWDVALVADSPYGVYRLRVSPDEPHSLLRIQVIADKLGKCGALGMVHALNIMCGFEESIGID